MEKKHDMAKTGMMMSDAEMKKMMAGKTVDKKKKAKKKSKGK